MNLHSMYSQIRDSSPSKSLGEIKRLASEGDVKFRIVGYTGTGDLAGLRALVREQRCDVRLEYDYQVATDLHLILTSQAPVKILIEILKIYDSSDEFSCLRGEGVNSDQLSLLLQSCITTILQEDLSEQDYHYLSSENIARVIVGSNVQYREFSWVTKLADMLKVDFLEEDFYSREQGIAEINAPLDYFEFADLILEAAETVGRVRGGRVEFDIGASTIQLVEKQAQNFLELYDAMPGDTSSATLTVSVEQIRHDIESGKIMILDDLRFLIKNSGLEVTVAQKQGQIDDELVQFFYSELDVVATDDASGTTSVTIPVMSILNSDVTVQAFSYILEHASTASSATVSFNRWNSNESDVFVTLHLIIQTYLFTTQLLSKQDHDWIVDNSELQLYRTARNDSFTTLATKLEAAQGLDAALIQDFGSRRIIKTSISDLVTNDLIFEAMLVLNQPFSVSDPGASGVIKVGSFISISNFKASQLLITLNNTLSGPSTDVNDHDPTTPTIPVVPVPTTTATAVAEEVQAMSNTNTSTSTGTGMEETTGFWSRFKTSVKRQGDSFSGGVKDNIANDLNNRAVTAVQNVFVKLGVPEFVVKNLAARNAIKFSLPMILEFLSGKTNDKIGNKLLLLGRHAQRGNGFEMTSLIKQEFGELMDDISKVEFGKSETEHSDVWDQSSDSPEA